MSLAGIAGLDPAEIDLGWVRVEPHGMASPMRKKRAWSTPEQDADSQESAAFAARVAAAKDAAAKSGAFLSSAKEDLTDHQRWLRAQSAAVERDRQRHERWVQRQRDQEQAALRRQRVRRRRLLMRQRAVKSVQQAVLDLFLFVRSWIVFVAGSIAGGVRSIGLSIGRGFAFVGNSVGNGRSWLAAQVGSAVRKGSDGLKAGTAWSASKVSASARAGRAALTAGSSAAAAATLNLTRLAGRSIGEGFSTLQARGARFGSATSRAAGTGVGFLAAKSSAAGKTAMRNLSTLAAWTRVNAAALPPALYVQIAKFSQNVRRFTRAWAPRSKIERHETETPDRSEMPAGREIPASAQAPGQAASVHVIEVYGPHRDGASLFGRPANEAWTPEPAIPEPALAEAWLTEAKPGHEAAESLGQGPLVEGSGVSSSVPNDVGDGAVATARSGAPGVLDWLAVRWGRMRVRAASLTTSTVAATNEALAWTGVRTARLWASAKALPWNRVWDRVPSFANKEALAKTTARAQTWASNAQNWAQAAQARIGTRAQSLTRTKDVELSQMMIVAGAVLLVCGGLLVGGGLLMRAGARAPVTAAVPEETFSGITWTFNEPDLPLPERAVFTLSGTPQSFLINGLSISGVNNSDQPLTALEGVLRPDVQRPDLKLALEVDAPQVSSNVEASAGAAQGPAVLPSDAVPAHTPFRLVFPFPAEAMDGADGISVEEFFESYGGLFLTLRYEIDGVEKSVFQYLAPDMLKAQLQEVSSIAGGS